MSNKCAEAEKEGFWSKVGEFFNPFKCGKIEK
jgi:hypothetical protein